MRKAVALVLTIVLALAVILTPIKNSNAASSWGVGGGGKGQTPDAEYLQYILDKYFSGYSPLGGEAGPEDIYDANRIDIEYIPEDNSVRVRIKAEIGDTVEYYIASGGGIIFCGEPLEEEATIDEEGLMEFGVAGLIDGENVFTVVVTRNGESFRNSVSFTHSPSQRPMSAPTAAAPGISGMETEGVGYKITWDAGEGEVYNVYRSENGIEYILLAQYIENGEYTDSTEEENEYTGLKMDPNTTYFYAVRAVAGGTFSDFSNILEVRKAPKSVTGIIAEDILGGIRLSWEAANGAEWYKVTAVVDGTEKALNVVGTSIELIGSGIEGITVRAVNGLGMSDEASLYGSQTYSVTEGTDSDGDGLSDFEEEQLGTDAHNADSDGDGLSDGFELLIGTNPMRYDTDGNGIPDGAEAMPKTYYDTVGDRDRYIVSKSLESVQISIIGDIDIFRSKIVINKNLNVFLNGLNKAVLFPVDVFAENADSIELCFDIPEEWLPSKENLGVYYVNHEAKSLERVDATLDGAKLTASVTQSGTYLMADESIETDYSQTAEVVILIEKQYYYDAGWWEDYCNGHTETVCPGHEEFTCPGHEESYCEGHINSYCPGHVMYFCSGHDYRYCSGHTEYYCPGHESSYFCVVHPKCNGGRPDCIVMVPESVPYFYEKDGHEHGYGGEIQSGSVQPLVAPPLIIYCNPPNCRSRTTYCDGCKWKTEYCVGCIAEYYKCQAGCTTKKTYCQGCKTRIVQCGGCESHIEYCEGCETATTYCSGCKSRWVSYYKNKLTDGTYKEIDVAKALAEALSQAGYTVGVAQNISSGGVKASFSTTLQQKLTALNGMKNYYGGPTQGADLSNAVGMFTGGADKRVIYIRLNGTPSALKTKIQTAYGNGIQTDVISMFEEETDVNKTALTQAAEAGGGGYYGVDINNPDIAQAIEEICGSLVSVWETEEWVYGGEGRTENRQLNFSDLYAGLESESAAAWLTTASTNLLTGGYIGQSTDILNYGGSGYLQIERTYNSLSGNTVGLFGKGYSSVFDSKAVYTDEKALVMAPAAELAVSAGGEAARYVAKGTEAEVLGTEGIYTKISYDGAEYYIKTSDLYQGGWYSVTLPTGSAEKFINEGHGWKPLSGFASFSANENGCVYTSKDRTAYRFDQNGRINEICDKKGEKLTFSYEAWKITVEDIYGNAIEAAVANGKITALTMQGKTVSYAYDGDFLTSVDWFGERRESYGYHYITGLLEKVTDAYGNTVLSIGYDMLGRVRNKYIRYDTGKTSREAFVYDNLNYEVYDIKPNGTKYRMSYNAFLEPVKESYIDGSDNEIVLWQKEYWFYDDDAEEWVNYTGCAMYGAVYNRYSELVLNGVEKRIDHTELMYLEGGLTGVVTTTYYDERGNTVTVTDARGNTETYTYDEYDNVVLHTDKLGNETLFSYVYGADDYLTATTTYANGAAVSAVYDRAGNKVKETDALGFIRLFAYNAFGEPIYVLDGERITAHAYDLMGNNTLITDANGNETRFAFDAMGRLGEKTNADGSVVGYTYDALGNTLSTRDGNGNVTAFEYDRYGNKTKTRDALSNETVYAYDEMNNLVSETNALGETKQYSYDKLGNLTGVTQGGVVYIYEYDVMGNLTKTGDPATYAYDALGRMISKTDRKGGVTAYEYDSVGNLTAETSADGEYEYAYDLRGGLTSVTKNSLPSQSTTYTRYGEVLAIDYGGGYEVRYTYDACGNRIKTQFLGEQLLYTYDSMNRVKTVTAEGVETKYTYDANGNTLKTETGNDISSEYEFNALNLPTRQTSKAGAATEANTYSYDALGRITQKNENGVITAYRYDTLGRLSAVTEVERLTEYTYDTRSNRAGKIVTEDGLPALTETYAYDANGRLTTLTSGGAATSYTYDANGNQTGAVKDGEETETYVYNSRNELISANLNDELSQFSYYASGLRQTKDGTTYVYDGKDVLAEIEEDTIRLNIYGNALILTIQGNVDTQDGELTITDATVYAYSLNLHGDIISVISLDGVVFNSYRYDAFGNLTEKTEYVANSFYYAGYQYDSETGLYYLRSRYYNPETARFLTEDIFSGYYSDPLSLNKYTYCHNNPISYYDPYGFAINRNLLMTDAGGGGGGISNRTSDDSNINVTKQVKKERNFLEKIGDFFVDTCEGIGEFFVDTSEKVADFVVDTVWNGIVVPAWEWTEQAVTDAWEWTEQAATDAWEWTEQAVTDAWDWTKQAGIDAWNWVTKNYRYIIYWIGVHYLIAGIVLSSAASAGIAIPIWVTYIPVIIDVALTIWQGLELYQGE